tara:strand:+ start:8036 stop:8389 length:354 start_codon:yes stop_codon:yes gene_type:complete
MSEKEYTDFATVRDLLVKTNERRGELSYEQTMALQHAEWAASENRGGIKTDSKVFAALRDELAQNEKLAGHPEICAKLAELCPTDIPDVRVVIASKRIAMDTPEIEEIITLIRQHVL